MSNEYVITPLKDLLQLTTRSETVEADKIYNILGAHWYAEGLYIKDTKPGSSIQADKLYRVEEGDFVYNRLFAWKGSFAIANSKDHNCYVSNEFPIFKIDSSKVDAKYLWRYFSRASAWDEALGLSSGGTPTSRNRLKEEKLLAMEIPLLPLEEQRRVVARIEALAAKIEEARGLRWEAVEEAELLFVSKLRAFFESSNSKKQPQKKLASDGLATVIAGQHIMADEYNLSGDGFPYITGPADFGEQFPEITRWTTSPKAVAFPGDVLLTVKGAGVGKLNFASDKKVAIGRQIMAIRPNEMLLSSNFIYYFLKYKETHFQSITTATTVPGIKKSDVEDLLIPLFSIQEQQNIVKQFEIVQTSINTLKRHQSQTSAELDALLPSILDKAFKGEL